MLSKSVLSSQRQLAAPRPVVSGLRVSPVWGGITLASIALLWILASSALWLLAFIGLIVLTHEGGHLVAARRAGMEPTEFFWGFGPEIVGFDIGKCRYGIKAIFLGGYVKLWGMTPTSELPEGVEEAGTYRAASHGGRLATILAGPGVNIASAVVVFFLAELLDGNTLLASASASVGWVWFVIASTGESLWLFVREIQQIGRAHV